MSFVITYTLYVHDEDIENIGRLNGVILYEYEKMEHALNTRPFRDMGWKLQRADGAEFWAAHLNHFGIKEMVKAIKSLNWDHPESIILLAKTENDRTWQIIDNNWGSK